MAALRPTHRRRRLVILGGLTLAALAISTVVLMLDAGWSRPWVWSIGSTWIGSIVAVEWASRAGGQRASPTRWRLLWASLMAAAGVMVFVAWGAGQKDSGRSGAIFGGVQAVVSLLGLIAGVAAVLLTLGPYLQWRREQFGDADLAVIIAAGEDPLHRLQPLEKEFVTTSADVMLSVSLSNQSNFNVRGLMMNIAVPATSLIQRYPVGEHDNRLRFPQMISTNAELVPGETIEVHYATANLDLMPPGNWYTFAVQINLKSAGRWPVLINVSSANGGFQRLVHVIRQTSQGTAPPFPYTRLGAESPGDGPLVVTTN